MISFNDDYIYIFSGPLGQKPIYRAKKNYFIPKLKPYISNINDVSINKNSYIDIKFSFDAEEPKALKFLISSSDTNLIYKENIKLINKYGDGELEKWISLTPAKGQYGTSEITILIKDGTDSAISKFKVTVLNTRIKPSISKINDVIIDSADIKPVTVDFQVNGEVLDSLRLLIKTSNPELLPLDSLRASGANENRKLTISPTKGKIGECIVTILFTDGMDSSETSFNVKVEQVSSVNDEQVTCSKPFVIPNPSSEFISISNPEGFKIELYNSLGKRININSSIRYIATLVRVDVSNLPAGVYFVKINNHIQKFVVLK